jgi:predicted DNA-binding transcriptional regulator AlpA
MSHQILFLPEVADRLRLSTATVNRLLSQRRRGEGTFPLPLSTFKGKGRWLASDVDHYIENLSTVNASPKDTTPVKKPNAREYQNRQRAAKDILRKHGINR